MPEYPRLSCLMEHVAGIDPVRLEKRQSWRNQPTQFCPGSSGKHEPYTDYIHSGIYDNTCCLQGKNVAPGNSSLDLLHIHTAARPFRQPSNLMAFCTVLKNNEQSRESRCCFRTLPLFAILLPGDKNLLRANTPLAAKIDAALLAAKWQPHSTVISRFPQAHNTTRLSLEFSFILSALFVRLEITL